MYTFQTETNSLNFHTFLVSDAQRCPITSIPNMLNILFPKKTAQQSKTIGILGIQLCEGELSTEIYKNFK